MGSLRQRDCRTRALCSLVPLRAAGHRDECRRGRRRLRLQLDCGHGPDAAEVSGGFGGAPPRASVPTAERASSPSRRPPNAHGMSRLSRIGSPACRLPRDKAPARWSFVRRPIPCLQCERAKSSSTTTACGCRSRRGLPSGTPVRRPHHRCRTGVHERSLCRLPGWLFMDGCDGRELDLVHDAGHRRAETGAWVSASRQIAGGERRLGTIVGGEPEVHRHAGGARASACVYLISSTSVCRPAKWRRRRVRVGHRCERLRLDSEQ